MSELAVGSLKGLAANDFVIDVAAGSRVVQPGAILQVVSTTKADSFSTTSATFGDVTGLSATITPSSVSSKILILAQISSGQNASEAPDFRFMRDSTEIGIGNADGSKTRATGRTYPAGNNSQIPGAGLFLDSPATTSSVTYKVQFRTNTAGNPVFINRSSTEADNATSARTISTITLMEVAG